MTWPACKQCLTILQVCWHCLAEREIYFQQSDRFAGHVSTKCWPVSNPIPTTQIKQTIYKASGCLLFFSKSIFRYLNELIWRIPLFWLLECLFISREENSADPIASHLPADLDLHFVQ